MISTPEIVNCFQPKTKSQNIECCSNCFIDGIFQDPNADTEWNDALRRHGIIPQKDKEISEDDIINLVEQTVEQKNAGIFNESILYISNY